MEAPARDGQCVTVPVHCDDSMTCCIRTAQLESWGAILSWLRTLELRWLTLIRLTAPTAVAQVTDTSSMSRPRQQRLLIIALNFAPELTGIGKYVADMTTRFAEADIAIRVIAAPPYYPAWTVQRGYSAGRYARETRAGALVYRCPLYVPRQASGSRRLLHLLSFALSSFPLTLWLAVTWRPHTVFVVEPPLVCAPASLLAARLCRAHTWLHVQDFEVDAAFELGLLRAGALRRAALACERWLLRRFDRVSTISAPMLRRLSDKGVDAARTCYFPNWVDTTAIGPLHGSNPLRARLGIPAECPVLLYSGNMGEKQGLDLILQVAERLAGTRTALFLLCGDGAARSRLEAAAAGATNLRFIPLQPLELLNELLNLADVHLLPQRADAQDLVMPSKLSAIMASGRPVIVSARDGSDLAQAAAYGGLVVPPSDAAAFEQAIGRLLDDGALRQRLGESGRAYATEHWDREVVLGRAVALLLHTNDTSVG